MTQQNTPASYGLMCHEGAPPLMGNSHRHNDIEINFIISGGITYHFGSSTITLDQGCFCLFWAAMPHQLVDAKPDTRMYWITLPLAQFLKWTLPQSLAKPVLAGRPISTHDTAMDELLLRRWDADIQIDDQETHRIMLMEVEARLRRLARELSLQAVGSGVQTGAIVAGRAPSSVGVDKAEHMSRYIAEHFAEPLRVEQVAKSVHIHPTYAMHLFRETFGVSIINYLTQHRIAHAQQLLATSDKSVMEIALESGFNSVSRFYTAFNSTCGKSPRAYRESLRAL